MPPVLGHGVLTPEKETSRNGLPRPHTETAGPVIVVSGPCGSDS